jgi:hypothetical protein
MWIRMDLLMIAPLFEVMFLVAMISSIFAIRKYHHHAGIGFALAMGTMLILWPIYVVMGILH